MHKPFVPEESSMPELTFKSLFLGIIMAVVLGAANAYLGLKAGMTIAAAFPAAVIAIAAFRLPFMKGSVLEQNIARTTASVGEALVAGAIFTLPAFVMVNVGGERLWTSFNYWESSMMLLVGGVMGILFVILLRKTLVVDAELPFPEGYACYEIVRAGQKGESGAKYVFGAMGLGIFIEFLKNSTGFGIIKEVKDIVVYFPQSVIHHYNSAKESLADITHGGGLALSTPLSSPALLSVGYIIGPRYSAINFSGGIFAWLVFIPLAIFLNPDLATDLAVNGVAPKISEIAYTVWKNQVQPIAVGAMLVGSIATLWGLRKSLAASFKGIFSRREYKEEGQKKSRLERDLNLKVIFISAIVLVIPMTFLYHYFTKSIHGAIVAAVIMLITGFLFSAVGGWLVGLVGNSNQPVSGLTLSTLIIAAVIMLFMGIKGIPGIAAVLAIAAVVCCAACLSGDMIQDLKVGQLIGGTPWKMEVAEIISTVIVAFVLVLPITILHQGNIAAGGIGIGDVKLPAPQAGLMAQLATGIVGGQMPWGLIAIGMCLSIGLLMISAPAPMLIAVGMYLPFETTFAIFVGGVIKFILDKMTKNVDSPEKRERIDNTGILIASGFIAGEALTGVLLAGLVVLGITSLGGTLLGPLADTIYNSLGGWLSILVFAVVGYLLIFVPKKKAR
ncbi:MAG TPA: oligopeptide transporter, OPT family [bacterium]|nr:oligopeptide transporter, OPT family [Myxococcales bacterium]HPW45217.1 oligopeptide transporter, OPT family [bacterium]HQC50592.1 oligopeptide transporter, OPT family [bacterium]HQG13052.1 oligopeptide transporter, OPT family [bacterium]HQH79854.1 oligopeptide transporter, OPT family [bacterium]